MEHAQDRVLWRVLISITQQSYAREKNVCYETKIILARWLFRVIFKSYFASDTQWVSQPVSPSILALNPYGTHNQILAVVKTVAVLFVVGRSPCREDGSVHLIVHDPFNFL
jgi:hypothetical protein